MSHEERAIIPFNQELEVPIPKLIDIIIPLQFWFSSTKTVDDYAKEYYKFDKIVAGLEKLNTMNLKEAYEFEELFSDFQRYCMSSAMVFYPPPYYKDQNKITERIIELQKPIIDKLKCF